jgi:hypothetical protein
MTTKFEFGYIGWCKEGSHDKIWGYFYRPSPEYEAAKNTPVWSIPVRNVCVFWGRRGKALQFKANTTGYDLYRLEESKSKKGYTEINEKILTEIWTTFASEAELKLSFEVLAGNVK